MVFSIGLPPPTGLRCGSVRHTSAVHAGQAYRRALILRTSAGQPGVAVRQPIQLVQPCVALLETEPTQ